MGILDDCVVFMAHPYFTKITGGEILPNSNAHIAKRDSGRARGIPIALSVDGPIWHRNFWKKVHDATQDSKIFGSLFRYYLFNSASTPHAILLVSQKEEASFGKQSSFL